MLRRCRPTISVGQYSYPPAKPTYPLKIDGWKMQIRIKKVPLLLKEILMKGSIS